MTDAQDLLEEWTDGETTGVRPARVQALRDDLMEHTDLYVPRRVPEIENWLQQMKGQVTRKLREAVGAYDSEESDEDADVGE